jgi:hypothetical protein
MSDNTEMFLQGVALAQSFCELNAIPMPTIERLDPSRRNYHIGTCAYYRPTTIHVMVEKCAGKGFIGRAWSWPGYKVDRTPYGVVQHELGHHVDTERTGQVTRENVLAKLFSRQIWEVSREPALTGYLGTDKEAATFFMEWFAENFRLFVTNPDLSFLLRPRFYEALRNAGLIPMLHGYGWESILRRQGAPPRIIEQARKQIAIRAHSRAFAGDLL